MGVDCSEIIDQIIEKIREGKASSMSIITDCMEEQRNYMAQMTNAFNTLADAIKSTNNNNTGKIRQQQQNQMENSVSAVADNPAPVVVTGDGYNTPDGVQLTVQGHNTSDEVRPIVDPNHNTSDEVRFAPLLPAAHGQGDILSVHGSNLWFGQGDQQSTKSPSLVHQSRQSAAASPSQKTQQNGECHDADQTYWQQSTMEYEDNPDFGPEISSSIAGAAKIFWHKPLKDDAFNIKLKSALTPSNCTFLEPPRSNREIWTTLSGPMRSTDAKLQEIQKTHSASVTMLLKAAASLTDLVQGNNLKHGDIKEPMNFLKESLSLAGKVSQTTNQLRRDMVKPALPQKYKQLASMGDDSSKFLFGDSISENVESLNKENKLNSLLGEKSKPNNKRKYNNQWSSNNWSSSKAPKRTFYPQGQKYNHNNNSKVNKQINNDNKHNNPTRYNNRKPTNNKQYKQKQD